MKSGRLEDRARIIAMLILLLLASFALGLGSERLWGARDMSAARAALRAQNYGPRDLRPDLLANCGGERGASGYRWRAVQAEGHVCIGSTVRVFVDRHF
jgi:hypothetical protein